jgi:putative glutathione S-transferase
MESAMGLLIEGRWADQWYDTKSTGGRFVRQDSAFRGKVTADGSSGFKAEAGRYHLYVCYACPWAHRTLIVRALKGLEDVISVDAVDPYMGAQGWTFDDIRDGSRSPGATGDRVNGKAAMHEIYTLAKPDYTGRVTVPVLWDKQTRTIVNNESAEIIRMLNSEFDEFADRSVNLSPAELLPEIDAINADVYDRVNNGVYKAGFATDQAVYDEAVTRLFEQLERLEARLSEHRWLVGDRLTEADIRLFTTLLRFDPVYHGHFKCNLRPLHEYTALWGHTREIAQLPGVAATIEMAHIKRHYYESHHTINPTGIVPKGPLLDLAAPHGRGHLPEAR